jgi:hypothetical protein
MRWVLVHWLVDYDGLRLCLRTAATNGPIVHPPGDMWTWWWFRLGKTPDSYTRALWQSCQHRRLGASRRNGRRREHFAYQCLRYVNGSLTCRKISRRGTSCFISHPKEGVLRIFISLKNASSRPGLNPLPFGLVANTLTIIPPRWRQSW